MARRQMGWKVKDVIGRHPQRIVLVLPPAFVRQPLVPFLHPHHIRAARAPRNRPEVRDREPARFRPLPRPPAVAEQPLGLFLDRFPARSPLRSIAREAAQLPAQISPNVLLVLLTSGLICAGSCAAS